MCSFYRPPDSKIDPLLSLQESLQEVQNIDSSCPIILAGDFNLPDISWENGIGHTKAAPMYGCEVNNLFVDILNDCGLEQLVNSPTRNTNTLDLVLTSHPNMLSETRVVPGISDHEAIFFQLYQTCSKVPAKTIIKFISTTKQTLKTYIENYWNSRARLYPMIHTPHQ